MPVDVVVNITLALGVLLAAALKAVFDAFSRPPSKQVDLTEAARLLNIPMPGHLEANARTKLGMDVIHHYNFAVVGVSGAGKSSLINGLRLMKDDAQGAAPVGEVETTKTIRSYKHPTLPHLVLWDVPGAGTQRVSAEDYFEEQMLYAFDAILVLSADRFMKVDVDIARKARVYKRPCAFVRSKSELAVKSKARRGKTMLEASRDLRQEVTESLEENMGGAHYKLFFLSPWAFTEPDETYEFRTDRSLKCGMDESQLLHFMVESASRRKRYTDGV